MSLPLFKFGWKKKNQRESSEGERGKAWKMCHVQETCSVSLCAKPTSSLTAELSQDNFDSTKAQPAMDHLTKCPFTT